MYIFNKNNMKKKNKWYINLLKQTIRYNFNRNKKQLFINFNLLHVEKKTFIIRYWRNTGQAVYIISILCW